MTAVPTVVDESPTPVETHSTGSGDLPDPYEDRRRQIEEGKLHEQRALAVKVFVRRMKLCCSIQIVLAVLLVISRYWYAHAINLVMGAMGLYGAFKLKNEFLFVHIILLGLTTVKNIGLMYLQITTSGSAYEAFLIAVLFIDTLIVAPCAAYLSYWLYQSLGTELTGVRFSDADLQVNGAI